MAELTFYFEKLIQNQDDYDDFDGPLDMMLLLLSRDKIEIQDISLSHLVDQYLAELSRRESMDMEMATEFTVMASHLVYLKTRMLLTVGDQRDEEVDTLLLALQKRQREDQYNAVKWAADWLTEHAVGFDFLAKPPSPPEGKDYKHQHEIAQLLDAYREVMARVELEQTPIMTAFEGIVGHEHFPVENSMEQVLIRLRHKGRMSFVDLLRECPTRSQRIAVFLAVLELCKDCKVKPLDDQNGLWLEAS